MAAGIFFVLISAGCGYDAYAANISAAQSSYTQANGVRENATITVVDNDEDCHGGCTYSATVYVTLPTPVKGQTDTVVNVPEKVNQTDGQQISVLVDPQNPGYAELPGHPDASGTATIWVSVIAAAVLAGGIGTIVRGVRMRLRTQSWRYVSS